MGQGKPNVLVRLERPEDSVGGLEEVAGVRRRPAQVRDHDLRRLRATRDSRASAARRTMSSLTAFGIVTTDLTRGRQPRATRRCSPTPRRPPTASGDTARRSRRSPAFELVHSRERGHEREASGSNTRSSVSKLTCRRARARPTRRWIASSQASGAGRTPRSGLRPSRGRSTERPHCVRCRRPAEGLAWCSHL